MEDDDRELLRRLFVAATALSESAQEAAIAGQASTLATRDYADAARRLLAAARGVAALAEAAAVMLRLASGNIENAYGVARLSEYCGKSHNRGRDPAKWRWVCPDQQCVHFHFSAKGLLCP